MSLLNVQLGVWDLALLVVVTAQATVMSYVHSPRAKALVWTLPIPFTLASLALGTPMNTTNAAALYALLFYVHAVRLLHVNARVPIALAIAMSALAYCAIGWLLAGILPLTNTAFWGASAVTLALGILLYALTSHREEPGHRSPLPVWIKAPIVMAVVAVLIVIKNSLQGFMTFFPMVGVVGAYESRRSLWTMSRQVAVIMMTAVPLMATSKLTYRYVGLGPSLLLGWIALLAVLIPLTQRDLSYAEGGADG